MTIALLALGYAVVVVGVLLYALGVVLVYVHDR